MKNVIAGRLLEERLRLKLNKGAMAQAGGVVNSTYTNYEDGKRSPDGEFLSAIAAAGADVQYILTGVRSINPPVKPSTIDQHQALIKAAAEMATKFNLPEDGAADLLGMIYAIGSQNAELLNTANTLRPDQAALLDNVEHCAKEDQEAIKRMAFIAAKADKDETQSGKKKRA